MKNAGMKKDLQYRHRSVENNPANHKYWTSSELLLRYYLGHPQIFEMNPFTETSNHLTGYYMTEGINPKWGINMSHLSSIFEGLDNNGK